MDEPFDFSEYRKNLFYVFIVLFFIIWVALLVAGCISRDYQPNRDVGVTKLTATGAPDWSVLVTSGRDSMANDIIESSDGNYILDYAYTESFARLIPHPVKISRNGKIEDDQSVNQPDCGSYVLILDTQGNMTQLYHRGIVCPPVSTGEYAENSSRNFSVRGLVKDTSDGGLILGGIKKESYFISEEEFVIRHQSEYQETKEFAEKEWRDWCGNRTLAEANPVGCKSNPAISTILAKIAPNNEISWQRNLMNFSADSVAVTEMKSGKGYIAGVGDTIIQLTSAGTILNITQFSNISEYAQQTDDGHTTNASPVLIGSDVLWFDSNRGIIGKESLPAGKSRTSTRDGGLLIVDVKIQQVSDSQTEPRCFATKYNPDGSIAWTNTVHTPFELPNPTQVIQTSDGGFIVVSWADNQTGSKV